MRSALIALLCGSRTKVGRQPISSPGVVHEAIERIQYVQMVIIIIERSRNTEIVTQEISENVAASHQRSVMVGGDEVSERINRGLLEDEMIVNDDTKGGVEAGRETGTDLGHVEVTLLRITAFRIKKSTL